MVKKRTYAFSIDKNVMEEFKDNLKPGQKVSPLINNILIEWNKRNRKEEGERVNSIKEEEEEINGNE